MKAKAETKRKRFQGRWRGYRRCQGQAIYDHRLDEDGQGLSKMKVVAISEEDV